MMKSLCCRQHRFVVPPPPPPPPSLFRRASPSSRPLYPSPEIPPLQPSSCFFRFFSTCHHHRRGHQQQQPYDHRRVLCAGRRRRFSREDAAITETTTTQFPAMAANDYSDDTTRPYTVFIEGNVGSGKTTFLEQFADCPNVYTAKEPIHKWQDVRGHNFLGLMYEDPKRWSFAFQSIVQRTMLELHQARPARGQNIKIMERSIYSARNIFVENLYRDKLMAPPEYAVLDAWYKWLIGNVEIESDLIIYLRTDPEIAYQRIKDRNRSEEKDVPFEYIKHLHELHDKWLNVRKTDIPKNIPVVIVDANQSMDLVKQQFKGIRDLITKNASALIKPKSTSKNSEMSKNINEIQHISPNCKLMSDSTIVPAQRV